ncbi:MAG: hypothetical protein EOR60_16925 [Mesorhizobium sp.]|nr:MAG: hypothetical protein EOR60_16925 [Mesorhizobium sp.]
MIEIKRSQLCASKRSLKRPRPTLAAALHGSKALLLLSNTLSGCQRIADQHELALDAPLTEQFLGATSLGQWHPHGHHRLDFAVAKQLEQGAESRKAVTPLLTRWDRSWRSAVGDDLTTRPT